MKEKFFYEKVKVIHRIVLFFQFNLLTISNLRLVEVNDGNVHDFELELFEVTDKTPPSFNEPIKGNAPFF